MYYKFKIALIVFGLAFAKAYSQQEPESNYSFSLEQAIEHGQNKNGKPQPQDYRKLMLVWIINLGL